MCCICRSVSFVGLHDDFGKHRLAALGLRAVEIIGVTSAVPHFRQEAGPRAAVEGKLRLSTGYPALGCVAEVPAELPCMRASCRSCLRSSLRWSVRVEHSHADCTWFHHPIADVKSEWNLCLHHTLDTLGRSHSGCHHQNGRSGRHIFRKILSSLPPSGRLGVPGLRRIRMQPACHCAILAHHTCMLLKKRTGLARRGPLRRTARFIPLNRPVHQPRLRLICWPTV